MSDNTCAVFEKPLQEELKACFTTKQQAGQILIFMPFEPLSSRLPELAEVETRPAWVQAEENFNLPAACSSFVEMF